MLTAPKPTGDAGFTIVEMLVASAVIVVSVTAFILFVTGIAHTQRSADRESAAGRVLAQEMETLNGLAYDNLVTTPEAYEECTLADGTVSTQAVRPGPEPTTLDGVTVSITRSVRWYSTGAPITCANAGSLSDLKVLAVTATWDDGGTARTRTETVLRSAAQEKFTPSPAASTLAGTADLQTPGDWCLDYPGGGSTTPTETPGSPGAASTTSDGVRVVFAATGSAVCGYQFTDLTPGATYTAVLRVKVPAGSAPAQADALFAASSGVAPADGAWHLLTVTWIETGTSRIVGLSPVAARPVSSEATVSALSVYRH